MSARHFVFSVIAVFATLIIGALFIESGDIGLGAFFIGLSMIKSMIFTGECVVAEIRGEER